MPYHHHQHRSLGLAATATTMLTIIVILLNTGLVCGLAGDDDDSSLLRLLILHNNDMHARFEETSRNSGTCKPSNRLKSCIGGFARTAHEIRKYRTLAEQGQGPDVLYLNAGDTYTGTAWFGVHKWKIAADFINILRPDALCLGNHEFDLGVAGLAPFVDAVTPTSPIVTANLNLSLEQSLNAVQKSVILERQGRKIGIIGHLIKETALLSQTDNVIFLSEIASVREESEKLDKQGVKIIIVLGHSGYQIDQEIAAQVPLVDLVVGGHTNTFLWNGPQPDLEPVVDVYPKVIVQKASGKKVPVVQAYAYTKYLGLLNVTFNDAGDLTSFYGQPILLDASIPQEKDVLDLVAHYRVEIDELNNKVIGKSRVILDGNATNCRFAECNFGNLIADAFVYYVASLHAGRFWTTVPIALINGGGIRNTIDPFIAGGNVTRGELYGAIPFGSQVITLTLNGSDLLKTLELGVRSNGETSRGEFLQVSGLKVLYDLSKPVGSRVVSLLVRCADCIIPRYEKLDRNRKYKVVTNSFIADGGDGHYVLKQNAALDRRVEDLGDLDTVEWYIRRQSPIYPEVQGRISFVENATGNDHSLGVQLKIGWYFVGVFVGFVLCNNFIY